METIEVTISGRAWRHMVEDASPREDVAVALRAARLVRYGRGRRAVIRCSRSTASELAAHLDSIAGAVGNMTGEEREGSTEHTYTFNAASRIREALQ